MSAVDGTLDVASGRRIGAIVLAAGSGSRFGGAKLLAGLDGTPLLQHVLDTLASVEPSLTVVVLAASGEVARRIAWRRERRVVNPDPERGLSSSLRLGIDTCRKDRDLAGAFVVLGDQPRTAAATLLALAAAVPAAEAAGRTMVVPRYADGGGANPVLLLRPAWPQVDLISGDSGLGSIIHSRPDQVLRIDRPGSNPDVDTAADLRALERPG